MNNWNVWDDLLVTISYALSFVPAVSLLYFPFHKVMNSKAKRNLWISAIAMFAIMFAGTFCFIHLFGMSDLFYKLNSGIFYCLFLFLLLCCCKERKTAILFNFGIVGIVFLSLSGVTYYFVELFSFRYIYLGMTMVYFGILLVFYIPVLCFINRNTKMLISIVKGGDWDNIWFLPFSIMLVCALSIPIEGHAKSIFEVLCRLMCGVFAIFISHSLSSSREEQLEKQRLVTELSSQKEYYKALSQKFQEEKKARHDFRHAVMAVRSYIDADDKDGLVQYCEKLLENSMYGTDIPFSGNSVADGILYRYSLMAKDNNVRLEITGSVGNDVIEDMDMCVLLGNALENAFEACLRVQEDECRIGVRIEESVELLSITISNTFDGKINKRKEQILSRKRANEPGIGLQSIRAICEKYSGTMHVTYDEKEFNIMMLLNVERGQNPS